MIRKLLYRIINRLLYSGKFGDVALKKALFQKLPKHSMNYVDIGAYDGTFFDMVCREINVNQAVLFEPQPELSQKLIDRFKDMPNVVISSHVLSDRPGPVVFNEQSMRATSSMLKIDETMLSEDLDISVHRTRKLEASTLDVFMSSNPIHIDLLKIDVQGAELHVLRGAENTIKKTDYIWIEISFKPLYEKSAVFYDVYTFLNERGFIMISILEGYKNSKGELLQADCLFKKTA